jgi:hypothetical protein
MFLQGEEDSSHFMASVLKTNYDLKNIGLCIVNQTGVKSPAIESFKRLFGDRVKEIMEIETPDRRFQDFNSRKETMQICHSKNYDLYFMIEDRVQLHTENTLERLIQKDRTIIAPLIRGWGNSEMQSNFWANCDLKEDWYKENPYQNIIKERQRQEVWNVPHIDSCYLIKAGLLPEIWDFYEKGYQSNKGTDMAFCGNLRERQDFMYLDNTEDYGVFTK